MTSSGGRVGSPNIARRQRLDLHVHLRPVRWFERVPFPAEQPDQVDMVTFRENTEDIYPAIDLQSGSLEAAELPAFLRA